MGTVKRLAEKVKRGLREAHPGLRKTMIEKLALGVGSMLERQTPNTVESATPLEKTHVQTDPSHWSFRKLYRSLVSWFKWERRLKRCLQNDLPLPLFHEVMRN